MRHKRSTILAIAFLTFTSAVALTACAPEPPAQTATPTPTPTIRSAIAHTGDGVLRIGTLFPMTGDAAGSGAAQVAGTEAATREIDREGGVLGQPIELIHRNSAGDVPAAMAEFAARGVDVVLWDLNTPVGTDSAASVADADAVVLYLADLAAAANGVAADDAFMVRLRVEDPGLVDGTGGAQAYDGVVLAALAATAAGDDGGASVESALPTVSTGDTPCLSWGQCRAAQDDGRSIGYQHVTGKAGS